MKYSEMYDAESHENLHTDGKQMNKSTKTLMQQISASISFAIQCYANAPNDTQLHARVTTLARYTCRPIPVISFYSWANTISFTKSEQTNNKSN